MVRSLWVSALVAAQRRGDGCLARLPARHANLLRMLDADLREARDLTISEYDVLVQLVNAKGRRMRTRDTVLVGGRPCDLPGCTASANP